MKDLDAFKRELRRRQLANLARKKELEHIPLFDRRRYMSVKRQTEECYRLHAELNKNPNLKPFVTKKKTG